MSVRRIVTISLAVTLLVVGTVATATAHVADGPTGSTEQPVVKIGVLAPLEAGLVEFGHGIRNSVQLAVDQANTRKAIPGFTIELVAVDDSSDPAIGAAGAAALVADPAVIGVVGPYNSGVSQAALPVLSPAHLTLISPSNTLTDLTVGPDPSNPARPYDNYFRMVASDAQQAPFLAKRVRALGAKKVSVVSETKAVSKGLADAFATALTKDGGTIASQQVVPDGTIDFSGVLPTVLADEPDMLFFGGEYHVAAALRDQATAAGFTKVLVGGDGIKDDAYITDAGPESKGTHASSVGTPASSLKTARRFLAAYKRAKFDDRATDYGPYAYDAANIFIAAAKQALAGQDAIPVDVREQVVTAVQDTETKGTSGPVSFDEYGDTTHRVFTLYEVKGPKAKLAWVPITS